MENMLIENVEGNLEGMSIDQLLAESQNGVIEVLKKINNDNKKRDEKISIMEIELGDTKETIKAVKQEINVLGAPIHSKRLKNFKKICKHRVWELFNNDLTSCECILFQHYFFKRIYADIAANFDLDTYEDLNMENYELDTSKYAEAKEIAKYWTPSGYYVNYCSEQLIAKRDNGFLKSERCRALSEYLKLTNNGKINPFN